MNEQELTQQLTSTKNMIIFAHLSAFLGFVFPLGNVFGPLTIWLINKEDTEVIQHAKEVLNFQISFSIYWIVAAFLAVILIGFLIMPVIFLIQVIATIKGATQASDGKLYNYPLKFKFF